MDVKKQNFISQEYEKQIVVSDGSIDYIKTGENLRGLRLMLRVEIDDISIYMTENYVRGIESGRARPKEETYCLYLSNVYGAAEIIHERIGRKLCLK